MDVFRFNREVMPLLNGFSVVRSTFPEGDFGDLERIEMAGLNKLATVEFWSSGWVAIDVFDCVCEQQVMNVLLSPAQKDLFPEAFEALLDRLIRNA